MVIETASLEDAQAILELQRLACQSEAVLYQDFMIQPLTQSLEELINKVGNLLTFDPTLLLIKPTNIGLTFAAVCQH
jgi:hypothetical protein